MDCKPIKACTVYMCTYSVQSKHIKHYYYLSKGEGMVNDYHQYSMGYICSMCGVYAGVCMDELGKQIVSPKMSEGF